MAFFSKEPAPQKSVPSRPSEPAAGQSRAAVIGGEIVVEGTLRGSEPLLVEGTVKGEIDLKSDLRIGKTARVEARVHARNVVIEGEVKGDVSADTRLELVETAQVDGNLKAPKIVVSEGAKFRGNVDMGSGPAPHRPSPQPSANEEKKENQ